MLSKRRSSSGKTSPACSPRKTTDSVASWARSLDSTNPYLCHPGTGAGPVRVWLPDPKEPSRGAFSTLNISECPNDAVASSLSDVLEPLPSIPQRYFLSSRACRGILRRAAKRGKRLPPLLCAALEEVAGVAGAHESPPATDLASCGDHPFVIPQIAFGGNRSSGPLEVATARSAHPGPCGRLDFETETFVVAPERRTPPPAAPPVRPSQSVVVPPISFDCKSGGKTSFSVGPVAGTLRGVGHGGGHTAVALARTPARYCVRRLTPKEAERLQGLPDDYTRFIANSVENADGPRYKMIGNSFAVPVVAWLGRKLQAARLRAPSSRR